MQRYLAMMASELARLMPYNSTMNMPEAISVGLYRGALTTVFVPLYVRELTTNSCPPPAHSLSRLLVHLSEEQASTRACTTCCWRARHSVVLPAVPLSVARAEWGACAW